ncbi:MAG: RidA family protein [Mycoplasma sp.]
MKIINSSKAPAAIGPYCHGIKVGHFIYTSGQLPVIPEKGVFAEGIQGQTEQSLKNVQAVLEAEGYSLSNVVKTTVFLSDMANFGPMNEVYGRMFGNHKPARSCFQVARLPKDALVEIEVVAYKE